VNRQINALLRDHPALIVSGLYVSASMVGMFYSWAYLSQFGINIFNYAHISDFLLASLKEPHTWLLVALAIGLVLFDNAMSRRFGLKQRSKWIGWYGSPGYRKANNLGAIAIVLTFIFAFSVDKARNTRGGEGKTVQVTFADERPSVTSLLLGTTQQYIFLFDSTANGVDIHPIENIHSISFDAP
jgi:hypothetical protein